MNILVTSIVDIRKSSHNSRLHQFIRILSIKHEITVLSLNDWWKEKRDDKSKEFFDYFNNDLNRINIHYLTNKKVSPILQEINSYKYINEFIENGEFADYDVHFNYNALISGYFVAKKIKSMGINTVFDIADDLPEMIKTSPQIPSLLRPMGGLIGHFALEKNIGISKQITYTSESLKNSCLIPADRSKCIPNGVDIDLFKRHSSSQIKSYLEKLNLNNNFIIGYVGVLREWVDLGPVFKAFKNLNNKINIKMIIIGGGNDLKKYIKLAGDYGLLDKNIIFLGTQPYSEIPKYISCMDICIIPFKNNMVSQNSLPLKLFEYMSCEKPVLSIKLDGIVRSVGNRVLYASNAEDYETKIYELYKDEGLRKEMGSNGRSFVENNYTWTQITDELERVLLNVAR